MQKSFMLRVEQDKVIEAYVTHWQELEKQDVVQQGQEQQQVQQGQEQDKQDSNFFDQAGTTEAGNHNNQHESKVSQRRSLDKSHN